MEVVPKHGRTQLNFDARWMHNSALNEMFFVMGRNDFARGLNGTRELEGIDFINANLG